VRRSVEGREQVERRLASGAAGDERETVSVREVAAESDERHCEV
jgi:hypothetical protein